MLLEGGGLALGDVVVGQRASDHRALLDIAYPMENGIIRNWDDMTRLWEHTFQDELGLADTRDCKILLTEPPLNPKANRERMCEVMFERFGFDGVHVAVQAVLTLYAQGARVRRDTTCADSDGRIADGRGGGLGGRGDAHCSRL